MIRAVTSALTFNSANRIVNSCNQLNFKSSGFFLLAVLVASHLTGCETERGKALPQTGSVDPQESKAVAQKELREAAIERSAKKTLDRYKAIPVDSLNSKEFLAKSKDEVTDEIDNLEDYEDNADIEQLEDLYDAVQHNQNPNIRKSVLDQLDNFESEEAVQVLKLAIRDPNVGVRMEAIEKLGDYELYDAVTTLLEALNDNEEAVVVQAIESLEMVGDASIVEDLEPFLSHASDAVREAAEEAIDFLK